MNHAQRPQPGFTIPEAAEAWRCSIRHVRRLIEVGSVRVTRIGNRVIIPAEEVARVLEEGAPQPTKVEA